MVKDGQVVVATTGNSTANRDLKGKGRALGPSQTLYTPVFYTPSPPVAGMSGIRGGSASTSSSKPGANTKRKIRGRSKTGPRRELERVKDQVHLPNLSSANLKRLEELSKRHIALSSNAIPEIPDSQPSSPSPSSSHELHQNDPGDTQTKKPEPKYALDTNNPDPLLAQDFLNGLEPKVALNPHIRTLRTKLSEALQNTSYDPSHGNWASLSSILHLGVTAGGPRWVGARADGSSFDICMELEKRGGVGNVSVGERGRRKRGALDWCNAETEEEWFEWEKMFEKEMALKKRVEEWTKGVVVVEDAVGVRVPGLGLQSSQLQPSFSREEEEEEPEEGEEPHHGVVETSELIEQVLEGGEATTVHEEQSIPVTMALAKQERAKQAAKFQAKSVKEKKSVDPLRGANNPLGFSMTKRTVANAATVRANHKGLPHPPPHPNAHPQTSPSKSSPSKGSPSKHRLLGQTLKEKEAKEREEREKKEKKEKEERKKKNRKELISDLSDITSFPTPSFPESQLVTSTPPPLAARRGGLPPPPPFPPAPPPPAQAQAQPDAGAGRSTTPAFAGGFPGFISGFNNDPLAFTSGFGGNTPRTPRTPGKNATTSRPASPHKPLSSLAKPLFPVSPRSPGKVQAASAIGLQGPVGLKSKNAGGDGQKDEVDVRAKPGDMQQEPPRTPPPVRRTYGKSPLRASGSLSFVGSPIAGTKRKLGDNDELEGEGAKTKKARLEREADEDVVMANTTPPRKMSASSRAFSVYGHVSGDTYAGGQGQDRFQDLESVPVFSSVNATSNNQASNNNDSSSSSAIPGLKEGLPTLTELLASAKKGNKTRGGAGKLKRRKSARMGMLDVSPVKEPGTSIGGEKQSGMLSAEKEESGVVVEEEEEDSFFAELQDAKQEKEKEKDTDGQQPPPTQEEKQTGPTSTQSMLYGPGASRSLRSPETGTTSAGVLTTPRTPTKSHSHSQMRSFLTPRTPKTPTRTPSKAAHASMSMSMSQISPSRTPRTPRGAVGGSMSQPVPKTPGTGTNNKVQKTPGSGKTPRGSMSLSSSLPPGLGMGGAPGPNSPLGMRGLSGFPGLDMNTKHKENVAGGALPEKEEKEVNLNADNGLPAEDRPNAPSDPFDISLPPTSIEPNPDLYTNDDEDHHPGDFGHNHDEVDTEDIYVPGLDDDYGGLGLAYGYSNNNGGGGAYGVGGVYDDDGEGGITDLESPTKSLSSLAGSDSESDSDFDDDGELPQGPEEGEVAEGPGGAGALGGGEGAEEFVFEPDVVSTQKEEQMRLIMPSSSGNNNNNPFLDSSLRLGMAEPLALLQQYQSQSQISQSQERSLGRGRSPNKPLMSLQSSQPQSSSQSPGKSQSQRLMRRKSTTISPAKSSQAMYGKYNSQFDVKRRVEEVDKILERDLELDSSYAGSVVGASVVGGDEDEDENGEGEGDEKLFEGWLKDTSD